MAAICRVSLTLVMIYELPLLNKMRKMLIRNHYTSEVSLEYVALRVVTSWLPFLFLCRRQALLCVLAKNCSETNYIRLVEGLCNEHKIKLLKVRRVSLFQYSFRGE